MPFAKGLEATFEWYRRQRSEVRSQKSEAGNQKSDR
jgi:hypothetical protein